MLIRTCLIPLYLGILLGGAGRPAGATDTPLFPDPQERLQLLHGGRVPFVERGGLPADPVLAAKLRQARREQERYDLRHVRLEIDLQDLDQQQFRGVATQTVTSLSPGLAEIVFDLSSNAEVDSVTVNGALASHRHASDLLSVPVDPPLAVGESCEIRIAYLAGPGPAAGHGMTFQYILEQPNVWTLSQPSAGRYWWPCKDRPDDKADSSDVVIIAPLGMSATSNGLLRSVTPGPGPSQTWWWHGSYPIAPYLISVTAGIFTRLTDTHHFDDGSSMPLEYWVLPSVVSKAEVDCAITSEAIDLFEGLFGPYPFAREKYGVTTCGIGGGMEHQTNTSYGWFIFNGLHTSDWIYVHELAHMWWGDNVTCATWADCWLNEGFASWCEALWFEHRGGAAAYQEYMVRTQWVEEPSGPIYDYPDPFDASVIYNKGAWVVHMLRGVMGDEKLFRGLADYRALFEGRTVTTAQFQEVMEAAYGGDLDWFFDEWIHGRNRPLYRASHLTETTEQGRRVYIHLRQTQTEVEAFRMPVPLRIHAGATVRDTVVWSDGDHEDFHVDLPAGPDTTGAAEVDSVEVDPEHWILREVVTEPYGLHILTAVLDSTVVDSAVAISLVARGGAPPYYWEALDPLPAGVLLDSFRGSLGGAPTQAGDFTWRVRVTDSSLPMRSDEQRITWTIRPAPDDTTVVPVVVRGMRAVPNPTVRSTLLYFQAAGEVGPAEWRVFDPAGRLIATGRSPEPSGDGTLRSWVWDGRNLEGDRAPAGVYLVQGRLPSSGRTVLGRVVRLE